MTTIRERIDNHEPIMAEDRGDGTVRLTLADLIELCDLAGRAIDPLDTDGARVTVRADDLAKLVDEAHDKLHSGPHPSQVQPRDETELRNMAMHYAVQLTGAKIQASSGLDLGDSDVVGQAEKILAFLRG